MEASCLRRLWVACQADQQVSFRFRMRHRAGRADGAVRVDGEVIGGGKPRSAWERPPRLASIAGHVVATSGWPARTPKACLPPAGSQEDHSALSAAPP